MAEVLTPSWTQPSPATACKANEDPCAGVNRYNTGTKTQAALKSGTTFQIKSPNGTTMTSCGASTLEGEITDSGSNAGPAKAKISTASFSSCTAGPVTAEGLAWQALLENPDSGSGRQTISNMKLKVFFGGVTCAYTATPTFSLNGGASPELVANGAALKEEGANFICPDTATFSATYSFSAPTPLFVVPSALWPATLCKANEDPCAEANRYGAGTKTQAALKSGTNFQIKAPDGTTTMASCGTSTLEGEVTEPGTSTASAKAKISSASFSSCTTGTVTAQGLAWQASFDNPNGSGSGRQTISNMKLKVFFGGVTCAYTATPTFSLNGGASPELVANGAALKEEGANFICPDTATFSATYVIGSPSPVFVTAS